MPAGLHHDAVVVDAHNDFILLVARHYRFGRRAYFAERVLPGLREGGVDVQVLPVYVEPEFTPEGALRRALFIVELAHRIVEDHPDQASLCRTGDEVDAAVAAGRLALILSLEGAEEIGGTVELLRTFYRLGVRMASFTHFGRTLLAEGSAEEAAGGRLTRAGVAALREMEALGMIVDVSHLSASSTDHVLALATRPLVASHSCARALRDHHRNLTDAQLEGIAAMDGVIGVALVPHFIDAQEPTVDRVVDHIAHIASVAGIDHVGLGADFVREYIDETFANEPDLRMEGLDPRATIPGLAAPADLPHLTETLLRRGFGDAEIRKVLGENFLRVFRTVMSMPSAQPA